MDGNASAMTHTRFLQITAGFGFERDFAAIAGDLDPAWVCPCRRVVRPGATIPRFRFPVATRELAQRPNN